MPVSAADELADDGLPPTVGTPHEVELVSGRLLFALAAERRVLTVRVEIAPQSRRLWRLDRP